MFSVKDNINNDDRPNNNDNNNYINNSNNYKNSWVLYTQGNHITIKSI